MADYSAEILWERGAHEEFTRGRYSRRHLLRFDGGIEVPGSSSPHVVPLPWADPAAVDPEEVFVASISSCHMLWFLSIAAKHGYCVDRYRDHAVGVMHKNEAGKLVVARVTLRPGTVFSGAAQPDRDALQRLHHEAHEECFIANSVKTEIVCEPVALSA